MCWNVSYYEDLSTWEFLYMTLPLVSLKKQNLVSHGYQGRRVLAMRLHKE
jgi:hypothetical protein